jgi:translation elongation factor EF-4
MDNIEEKTFKQQLVSSMEIERKKKITKKNEISTFINKTFKIL